jgi:hypothetical protein
LNENTTDNAWEGNITGVSASLTATSVISANLQFEKPPFNPGPDIALASNHWLIGVEPIALNGGTIRFYLARGGTTPVGATGVGVSWAVTKF